MTGDNLIKKLKKQIKIHKNLRSNDLISRDKIEKKSI
jgi:hypothetical protein